MMLFLCRLLIAPVTLHTRPPQKRAHALQDLHQVKSFVSCSTLLGSPLPAFPPASWHETRSHRELAFLQAVSFREKRLLVAGPAHGKAFHMPGESRACVPPVPQDDALHQGETEIAGHPEHVPHVHAQAPKAQALLAAHPRAKELNSSSWAVGKSRALQG